MPRSIREAFLLCGGVFWRHGERDNGFLRSRSRSLVLRSHSACAMPAPPTCASNNVRPTPADPAAQTAANKRTVKLVTDETGRRMAIPAECAARRELAPNLTETIYALGLDAKLVGDTNFCDIPPAAKDKPHVGAPQDPSLEAIVALHPDLVLATTSINRLETADALLKIWACRCTPAIRTRCAECWIRSQTMADLMGAARARREA